MVVNRLQNGLINSSIAPWSSRINCQNIFFKWDYIFFLVILIEIFILKTTMYHKCTLKYQKFTKKKCKEMLLSSDVPFCAKHWWHICAILHVIICHLFFHFALNIGGIFVQSYMLLFVICFSSYLNLVITL
jgi:hypothetical protein